MKEIVDVSNELTIQMVTNFFEDLLNNYAIFDNRAIVKNVDFVWGVKRARCLFFYKANDLYVIATGTNINNFNVRSFSNDNIDTFIRTRNIITMMVHDMYRRYNNLNAFNVLEETNYLNRLMIENYAIPKRIILVEFDTQQTLNTRISDFEFKDFAKTNTNQIKAMNMTDTKKYESFVSKLSAKYIGLSLKEGYTTPFCFNDDRYDYVVACKCVTVSENIITFIAIEVCIQDCIIPALYVEGDARVTGDLLITNEITKENFVSIDPIEKFIGVNTDDRHISYQDLSYSTINKNPNSIRYNANHNVYVTNNTYPVMVSERVQESADDTGDPNAVDLRYFNTNSAFTVKRKSNLYDFDTINDYSEQLGKEVDRTIDPVTQKRYGVDVSFEVCDKNSRTVELGNVNMTIDKMGENGIIKGGFGVQVYDVSQVDSKPLVNRRNLLYVNNDGRLHINEIMLGGKLLSIDGSGNLLCDGKKVLTE